MMKTKSVKIAAMLVTANTTVQNSVILQLTSSVVFVEAQATWREIARLTNVILTFLLV
jgi:hypothetical protein